MTIYNYLELLFIILFVIEISRRSSQHRRLIFFYIESFFVFFILAFRNYNVGADSILYTNYYSNPNTYRGQMPWGFEFFCDFLKIFSDDWRFFIFVTSFLAIIPFLYYVKKYASIVSLPFLTFLLCWDLLWLLETPIKQTTAIAFFFWGYLLLIKEVKHYKWLKNLLALILIVFSVLNHSTIVIVIMVFLILHFVRVSKRMAVISIIISILLSSTMIVFIPSLFDTLQTYAMAFQLFNNIQNHVEDVAIGLITYDIKKILLPSLFVVLLLLMCNKKQVESMPAKCIVAGTIIFNLFIAFPNIPRVVLPFTLIGTALCPTDYKLLSNRNMKYIRYAHLSMILIFFYLHLKKCITFTTDFDADILPYSFWF